MVYFVGAGSGAADLITVRGMHMLQQADVIIYAGSLVNPELLEYARADCEIHNSAHLTLEEVLKLMQEAQAQGKMLVRLHTGEPSIYGAVREQMDALDELGIPYESCPGVSACFGAAASLNLEYTLPGVSQTLIITRMEGRTGVPQKESIESLAAHHASMAIYLSTGMLRELSHRLISGGYAKDTPAALVYKATWPEEEAYICTVETLAQVAEEHGIKKTALVLVGDVITHGNYQKSRLYAADFTTEFRQAKCGAIQAEDDSSADTICVRNSLSAWAGEQMAARHALIFIGACGIAVRAIAPWIMDKLHDSPVLVADEMGKYVIPLLSGHVGGANELAVRLAGALGAIPVITTATDLHDSFAVDIFAKRNDLRICNREGIAKVSAKVLAGEEITMSVQTGHLAVDETIPPGIRLCAYPPVEKVDVLIADDTEETFRKESAELLLQPKKYILGVGCKKDTDSAKLDLFLKKILEEQGIVIEQIAALASIDVKKEERCLLEFSEKYRIPFRTYTAQELQAVPGEFHGSEFVKTQVGVDNVCERAALKAAGTGGWILLGKQAQDGMTVAVAEKTWKERIRMWLGKDRKRQNG